MVVRFLFPALIICAPSFACTLAVSASLPNAYLGQAYLGMISAAADCPGAITFGIAGLPGVSVDPASGAVGGFALAASGTPFTVTVSAIQVLAGGSQLTASMNYSVLIAPAINGGGNPPAPCVLNVLSPLTLPPATVNQPYVQQLMVSSATCRTPITWISTAPLPSGLSLTSSGEITGSPTMSGMFTISITITSGDGTTVTPQFSISISPASSVVSPTSALPHFAAQDVWTTGILAVNTGTQPARFAIAFYDDTGKPISLPFASGAANTLSGTVPAQGSAYYEASDPLSKLIDGWGQITADPSIVIQGLFRENVGGIYYEAAVPSNAGSKEFEIPFDATTFTATGDQVFTRFAIANLDPLNQAALTCTARDSTGTVIANAFTSATGPPALNALGHWAGYSFPALTGKRGTIDCVSTTTIAAVALQFIGTKTFSSLPVINK